MEYDKYMLDYYQNNFKRALDVVNSMQDVDAKVVRKFYEYEWLKRDEEMVRADELKREFRSNMLDPGRMTAVLERMK